MASPGTCQECRFPGLLGKAVKGWSPGAVERVSRWDQERSVCRPAREGGRIRKREKAWGWQGAGKVATEGPRGRSGTGHEDAE